MGGLIIFIVVLFLIGFVIKTNMEEKEKVQFEKERLLQNQEELKQGFPNLVSTQRIISSNLAIEMILDDTNKQLVWIDGNQNQAFSYPYNDVLQSELIIDGQTVTNTSRGSQLGGALLGGILAGGVGAIIGGLSGSTTSKEDVKSVELKIVVYNKDNPIHVFPFFKHFISVSKTKPELVEAKQKAEHWHSLISVIIQEADREDKKNKHLSDISTTLKADELLKWKQLWEEGVITEQDFEEQKRKLLSYKDCH